MNRQLLTFAGMLALAALACVRPDFPGDGSVPIPLTAEPAAGEPTQEAEAPVEPTEVSPTEAPSSNLRIVYPRNDGGTLGDDDQLWLWDEAQAEAQQLTTTGSIVRFDLSDDGERVAWVHQVDFLYYDLWAVDAGGTNERMLVGQEQFATLLDDPNAVSVAPFQIEWIPGTHRLLYNTRYTYEGPGLALLDDLWMVDADSGEVVPIAGKGEGGRFYLSPDASQIAVVRPDGISVMDIDGGNRRDNLLTIEPIGAGEGVIYLEPVWTPDGSRLLVSEPPRDIFAEFPESSTVWEIMADGSGTQALNTLQAFPLLGPYFSPDGTQVVYQLPVGERIDNTWEMHIANADGSNDVVYDTQPYLLFMGFSPDSSRFVYKGDQSGTTLIGGPGIEPTPYPNLMIFNFGNELLTWIDDSHFAYIQREGTDGAYSIWIASAVDGSSVPIDQTGEILFPAIAIAP